MLDIYFTDLEDSWKRQSEELADQAAALQKPTIFMLHGNSGAGKPIAPEPSAHVDSVIRILVHWLTAAEGLCTGMPAQPLSHTNSICSWWPPC